MCFPRRTAERCKRELRAPDPGPVSNKQPSGNIFEHRETFSKRKTREGACKPGSQTMSQFRSTNASVFHCRSCPGPLARTSCYIWRLAALARPLAGADFGEHQASIGRGCLGPATGNWRSGCHQEGWWWQSGKYVQKSTTTPNLPGGGHKCFPFPHHFHGSALRGAHDGAGLSSDSRFHVCWREGKDVSWGTSLKVGSCPLDSF